MKLVHKTLALLAWLTIYVPTTSFVIFVMIKLSLFQHRQRRH